MFLETIFIDDGSLDNTNSMLNKVNESFGVKLLSHQSNRGPGKAFGTGFEYLSSLLKENDLVVTMEGDNTSRLDTLSHMLIRRKEGYDAVLASPYSYGGGIAKVTFMRMMISHTANGLLKLFLNLRGINTFSSFFRLYTGDIVLKLQSSYGNRIVYSNGFECMIELLVKLIKLHAKISEVEMKLDWESRAGKSKMKVIKTMIGYLSLIYKFKLGNLM